MSDSFDILKKRDEASIMRTYGRYPLAVSRAQGCRLYDLNGREYIDLLAGIAVANLGHSRPELAEVIAESAKNLIHVSNLFYQEPQVELAEKLLATCDADKVFFANSGAESNEGAIKLARRYMQKVAGREAYEIITLEGSFHGRTLTTLTATGQSGPIKDGFSPLPTGFRYVPVGDVCALRDAVGKQTAAIMIEMVQGEGGVNPLPKDYVDEIAAVCRENDILLIVDEVQTGMCRTGRFWAHQHYGIVPDIFTTAKGLANGLPMGAVMATNKVAAGFEPGSHATTFGGGGLLSSVAAKTIDIMRDDALAERAERVGAAFHKTVHGLIEKHPDKIAGVRGLGLMIGIELTFEGKDVWKALLDKGFVLNLTKGRVLRLLPPLVIEENDLNAFAKALDDVLTALD